MARRRRRTREEWRGLVSDWTRSGLSQREFCRRKELRPQTLARWVRKLAREQEATTAALVPFIEVSTAVVVPPPETTTSSAPPLVVVEAGIRVEVPVGFDERAVHRMLDLLEARR